MGRGSLNGEKYESTSSSANSRARGRGDRTPTGTSAILYGDTGPRSSEPALVSVEESFYLQALYDCSRDRSNEVTALQVSLWIRKQYKRDVSALSLGRTLTGLCRRGYADSIEGSPSRKYWVTIKGEELLTV